MTVVEDVAKQLYIGGEWRDAVGGGTLAVEDPATGEVIAEVADATNADADAALGAATEAFKSWKNVAPRERADILRRAYDLIHARTDELALLMTLEMGKPVAESRGEIAYANNFLRWYSEEAVRINGRFTTNEA
ncbi:MAG TPA: aldehyde dehydrogenase family protein, partial [Baekduia sp.]|nr:aldehyde dehydrogenase family protein [Baekduia sp.]